MELSSFCGFECEIYGIYLENKTSRMICDSCRIVYCYFCDTYVGIDPDFYEKCEKQYFTDSSSISTRIV